MIGISHVWVIYHTKTRAYVAFFVSEASALDHLRSYGQNRFSVCKLSLSNVWDSFFFNPDRLVWLRCKYYSSYDEYTGFCLTDPHCDVLPDDDASRCPNFSFKEVIDE